jgi:hypothetical protein
MLAKFPARKNFCRCLVQRRAEHLLPLSVFLTDEIRLGRDGIVNIHNQHQGAEDDPHGVIHSRHQQY